MRIDGETTNHDLSELHVSTDGEKITVLHVDDDEAFTELTEQSLENVNERLSVRSATDVKAGLQELERNGDVIDCIVSDYDISEFNGLEFHDMVTEQVPNVPFILFTGKGTEEIASEALSRGVTDYLSKRTGPDGFDLLANKIETIVDEKRKQKRIEGQFRAIVDNSPMITSVLTTTGEHLYVSPSHERILGYTPEELASHSLFELVHSDDRSEAKRDFEYLTQHTGEIRTNECRFRTADGAWRWLQVHGKNLRTDYGHNLIIVNSFDITAQKEAHRRCKRKNEQLEEFASVIAHDLRNPIQAANANLQQVKETADHDCLDSIEVALDEIETLLDTLLNLARQGRTVATPEPVDLNTVLTDARNAVLGTADHTVEIEADFEPVEGDPARLREAFENLFRNAVEHNSDLGRIRIGSLPDGSGLYVEDDGDGVPPEIRENVFEYGFSTDTDGSGFGLAIVRTIIEAHGWEISVTDGRTGGAKFKITGLR